MSIAQSARPGIGWTATDGRLGLADQLLVLRRRWRVICGSTMLLMACAGLMLCRMPETYTATGILLYDPDDAVIPGDPVAPSADDENQDAVTASQTAVIASLPAAQALAAQLNLASRPEFNPELRRRLLSWPLAAAPSGPQPGAVAFMVLRALNVRVVPNSRILTVSFSSTSAGIAAAGVNAAMQIYLNHERDQSFGALNDAQAWLQQNAQTVQAGLDETETQLAEARAAAGVVPGAQASLTTETASHLAASLVDAQADLAMNQARLNSAALGDAAAANAAIAPNLLPLRKEQADLTAQVQSLAGTYGPDYPDLRAAQASLAAITGEINAETARELDAARADVAADQAEIATLQNALNAARVQSQAEDADSAPIRALEQRADAGRDMLKDMTLQADQLAQEASLTKPDAKILSAAALPEAASGPHRGLILAASAGLGFCMGVLLAGLLEALDTSCRSGDDLRAACGLTCLALVPEVRKPKTAVVEAPFSVFAEQMRALQMGLGLSGSAGRAIAVTAARPGEGKTTLTIALGRTLAASGLRVVAVDGDVRQPGFDTAFALDGALGLTDHLSGIVSLERIIHHDRLSGLDVVPAGSPAASALALFLSPAMQHALDELRDRYDVVLLDVPPAFALAEGRVLSRLADATLLCVRWGHTPRRVVAAALALLQEAGVNLAGAALTRVDARVHGRSGFPDAEIYQPRYNGYFHGD